MSSPKPASSAVRAFRSAVTALGGGAADLADPTTPRVDLVEWNNTADAQDSVVKNWLEAPDAEGIVFEISVNGSEPRCMRVSRAPTRAADAYEARARHRRRRLPMRIERARSFDRRLHSRSLSRSQAERVCASAAERPSAAAGARVEVAVTVRSSDVKTKQLPTLTLARGWFVVPENIGFMGAPGFLVPVSVDAAGVVRSHLFAHVLNVEGAGRVIVAFTLWFTI